MRGIRKAGLALYLLAGTVVAGLLALLLFGPEDERLADALQVPWVRVAVAVCLAIVVLQMALVLVWIILDKPEPRCVRPHGREDIEVTCAAIASVARAAAAERDVLVEHVEARPIGRGGDGVSVSVEAIALVNCGLEGMAHRVQQRVQTACEQMLGCEVARVRVRFLPSKTVVVSKEETR